jgi:hypothetical protein
MPLRALIGAAVAAVVVTGSAAAHVKVVPTRIEPGQATLLTFTAPNERADAAIVALELTFPPDLVLDEVEQKPGWRDSVSGAKATWTGGRIVPRHFATFAVIATTVAAGGTPLAIASREVFAGGQAIDYRPSVTVTSLTPNAVKGRDSSARTLGKAALIVALVAAALAFAGFFIALAGWLRGPRQP